MYRQCPSETHFHSVNKYIYNYCTIQCYLIKDIIKRIGLAMCHFCRSDSFIGGGNHRSTQGTHRTIIYKVKQSCIELTSPWVGMELNALDTDWIGTGSKFYIRSRSRPAMIDINDIITYKTCLCQENYIIRNICLGYRFSLYFWVSEWILGRFWWCYFFPRFNNITQMHTDYAYISLIRKRFDCGLCLYLSLFSNNHKILNYTQQIFQFHKKD